ncbi:MAG: hypothetical protein RL511_796 [Bacteroidota bacterium]|jgi:hypothetical protein
MKKLLIIFLLIFSSTSFQAQYQQPKKSTAKGTLFCYWGYNRSIYTPSTIRFIGPGYDFKLKGVQAVDRPSRNFAEYVNFNTFTVPQFDVRIGYNFKRNWAISLGYEHMKYVMKHGPTYYLSGTISPGIDQATGWSGTYSGDSVVTNETTFHYENTNGLNYINFQLTNVFKIYQSEKGNVALTTLMGVGAGPILSYNDFTFAGEKSMETVSLSGLGASGHFGLRAEFFKHLFVAANVQGGFVGQYRVKTRPNDYDSHAKQAFLYGQRDIVVGALFYLKQSDKCNTCPNW